MKIVWMKYRKMKLKTREKKGNERFEDRLRKGRKGKSGVEDSERLNVKYKYAILLLVGAARAVRRIVLCNYYFFRCD